MKKGTLIEEYLRNEERAGAAYAGVCGYESHRLGRLIETPDKGGRVLDDPNWDTCELHDTICDLICDLNHLADQHDLDFQRCCETAKDHYESETENHKGRRPQHEKG